MDEPGARKKGRRAWVTLRFIRVKKKGPVANPTYAGIFQADAFGGYNRLYDEHVEMLARDAAAWNEWRANRDETPDLRA